MVRRAAVFVALTTSGGLWMIASRQRWGPCRPFDFDSPRCLRLQSYRYDYVGPTASWVPVGHAAQFGGVALILLAVAAFMLPRVVAPDGPRWLTWGLGAALSASVGIVGVATWLAGQVGHPVLGSALLVPLLCWAFGWPLALMVLAVLVTIDTGRLRWRFTVLALLAVSTPVAQVLFVPLAMVYAPEGSTPWADAVGAACLVAGAGALWIGTSADRITSRPPSVPVDHDRAPFDHVGPLRDNMDGSIPA